jgi:hypothetical protein
MGPLEQAAMKNKKPQCKKGRATGKSKRYLSIIKKPQRKKLALIIRGETRRFHLTRDCGFWDPERVGVGCDPVDFNFKKSKNNMIEMVINPLKERFSVETYVSPSYDSNFQLIKKTLNPKEIWYDKKEANLKAWEKQPLHVNNAINGIIRELKKGIDYDCYLLIRFDMIWKEKITNFINNFSSDIVFSFREVGHTTQNKKCVCDSIHWFNVNGDIKNKISFFNKLFNVFSSNLYLDAQEKASILGISTGFMIDGEYDTNTGRPFKSSVNPMYVLGGRQYFFDDFKNENIFKPRNVKILSSAQNAYNIKAINKKKSVHIFKRSSKEK